MFTSQAKHFAVKPTNRRSEGGEFHFSAIPTIRSLGRSTYRHRIFSQQSTGVA